MKAFVAICVLLAALCAVQAANPWNDMKVQISRTKSNVNQVSIDLKYYIRNLKLNTNNKLSDQKIRGMQQVNDVVNPALKNIRAEVDAAKAEGKDVEQCYENARVSLRSYSLAGYDDAETCKQKAEQSLQPTWNNLDGAQTILNNYITELDNLMVTCYSSNVNQMQTCVALKLGSINQQLRAMESSISSMKTSAQRATNDAFLSQNTCNRSAISTVRSGATQVTATAKQCIKS